MLCGFTGFVGNVEGGEAAAVDDGVAFDEEGVVDGEGVEGEAVEGADGGEDEGLAGCCGGG